MSRPKTIAAADDDLRAAIGLSLAAALIARDLRPENPNQATGRTKLRLLILRLQETALIAEELSGPLNPQLSTLNSPPSPP